MSSLRTSTAPAAFGRTLILACVLTLGGSASAWSAPILGSAAAFAVLGGATVTNTGQTTVDGAIGVAPGTAVTGIGSQADATAAALAHADALAAIDYLSGLSYTRDLTGMDLGGMTLAPGVYLLTSSAQLTGALILDAQHLANALFVFQIGSTLTTAAASSVSVINASADTGVFFDIGTSAVLGADSLFAGNILAAGSITLNASASLLCGRALAIDGPVTLDTNRVSNDCGAGDYGSSGFAGLAADVPEPATWWLMAAGLAALGYKRRRPQA